MDLKDFIKETLTAIVDATVELQVELAPTGAILNPPIDHGGTSVYEKGGVAHVNRKIQQVDFDVAVTASSETAGEARAGLKVWAIEAGTNGQHSRANEQVSRVRFQIPLVLPPTKEEVENLDAADRQRRMLKSNRPGDGF